MFAERVKTWQFPHPLRVIICCLTVNLSVKFTTDLAKSYSVHALKCLLSSGSFQAKGPIPNKVVKAIGIGEQI